MKSTNPLYWLLPVAAIFLSCAVREAPKGGPADTTPPTIVNVEPSEGSILIPPNSTFNITFTKSMNHENTEGAVFLSPIFWGYLNFKWSGRRLTVVPPQNLKPNTTYILTIGANAGDIHSNKLGQSHSFAFSTGAAIDSGEISGATFSTDGGHTPYDIWAYALGDSGAEGFWTRIPDYATQVDSTGAFRIENLGVNRYLVVAINDKNDDLFWDPSSEEIGLPPGIINLTGGEHIERIIFRPARRDTAMAFIARAVPVSSRRLSIEFSQQPKKDLMLNPKTYRITYNVDSLLNFGIPYIGESGTLNIETDPQIPGQSYQIKPYGLVSIWGMPFDTAGIRFTGIATPDTVKPRLLTFFPPNGSSSVYEDTVIEMTFSKRIQAVSFQNAVTVMADSTDTLRFAPSWIDPNLVRLRFPLRIPREKRINISLNPAQVLDEFQNSMGDSVLSYSFRLPPADTVGAVTASLEPGQTGNILGILTQLGRGGDTYKSHFDAKGNLNLEMVMPGFYSFEFFDDGDSTGEWSPGVISPFQPAERFSFLPDTVKVRSRWTTEIGSVSLPAVSR